METKSHPSDILTFWREAGEERWWQKNDAFDQDIRVRFMPVWHDAAAGKLDHWIDTDDGTLALVIVLDQFPSNMFRDDPRAFSTDAKACGIAHAAIEAGVDCRVAADLRQFFYLPLMHSEELADQESCVNLFAQLENEKNTQYALIHAEIIQKFGRFPHRNSVLGRTTTPDEQAFLDSGGFSG